MKRRETDPASNQFLKCSPPSGVESSPVLLEGVFAMTSAFSWQDSISLCPASFHIPRPNLPVIPGAHQAPLSMQLARQEHWITVFAPSCFQPLAGQPTCQEFSCHLVPPRPHPAPCLCQNVPRLAKQMLVFVAQYCVPHLSFLWHHSN